MNESKSEEDVFDYEAAFANIRSALAEPLKQLPSYGSHFTLLRWIQEYNNDINEVIAKLGWVLNTLTAIGAPNMDTSSVEVVNRIVRNLAPTNKYYPGGLMGYDKDRNVIFVQPFGRLQSAKVMELGRLSEFYRMILLEGHGTHELICAEEAKSGARKGQIAVLDFEGFSRHLIYMPGLSILQSTYRLLQLSFPGISKKVYLINAPTALQYFFNAVQIALSKKTKEAIEFLDSSWKQRLIGELGEENILPHWGGTMQCSSPTGQIRMAGAPPPDAKLQVYREHYSRGELNEMKISARKMFTMEIDVQQPGQTIAWYFECSGGDVDFFIRHCKKEVVPRFRLSTVSFPEFGEYICNEKGIYEVCFSNEHAKFWSKTVFCKVRVK